MNSRELVAKYKELHRQQQFLGLTLRSYQSAVWRAIRDTDAKTVYDFGAGKADAWGEWKTVLSLKDVFCYEPGIPHLEQKPKADLQFDLVIACDVLEHLLEPDVDAVIAHLFSHAKKMVWASVCCRPAKKCFPGTEINMHTCIQPYDWWASKFAVISRAVCLERFGEEGGIDFQLVETP
jgi:hypothetical protein